ncbi:hypothetical protein HBI56_018130 [Parastagonospora nodorum]|uniref:Uncharacterized protein n=1 Tax=Phaeosphaeria nodorum (strain SN15 / ATCC MYA-4574 / FGSC 10173) TaxID=321614 RepID=A0A7U2F2W0_PHANO|nr:hypothetical protein HBH56_081860 [Parastagonospora nodorum]QRC96618.1 hypothetical protein JI435_409320 [Parastagonospora nodorum SN15]KAH3929747.1 hypothetical protein HBH54_119980 [Parastagonospora nodorum]KAH3955749.1 hypothetical protein HBH53_004610 [Parastagonospora nodorum]KAH3977033.1 hypothetical protein HBH51_076930 [Parastagonospora nodorum]
MTGGSLLHSCPYYTFGCKTISHQHSYSGSLSGVVQSLFLESSVILYRKQHREEIFGASCKIFTLQQRGEQIVPTNRSVAANLTNTVPITSRLHNVGTD